MNDTKLVTEICKAQGAWKRSTYPRVIIVSKKIYKHMKEMAEKTAQDMCEQGLDAPLYTGPTDLYFRGMQVYRSKGMKGFRVV